MLRISFASLRIALLRFAREATGVSQPRRILVTRQLPREQFPLHTSTLIPRDAVSYIATMQPLLGVMLPEQHQFLTLRPSLAWPAAASGQGLSQHNADRRSDAGPEMATAGRTGGRCRAETRLLASGAGCAAAGRQYAFCLAAAREAAAFLRVQRPAAHAFRCTLHPVRHPAALGPARQT